jgi:hypothetical protein
MLVREAEETTGGGKIEWHETSAGRWVNRDLAWDFSIRPEAGGYLLYQDDERHEMPCATLVDAKRLAQLIALADEVRCKLVLDR